MSRETGRHQWSKGLRIKEVTTSEEGEDIWKDLQESQWARDHEVNIQVFCQGLKNE
jgi:hypothetical protein